MIPITDADRQAAEALRVVLANITGFWHKPGDDSPICQAMARHREDAEIRLAQEIAEQKQRDAWVVTERSLYQASSKLRLVAGLAD